ncbi:MAG: STAS domain-containing protein [Actinobacteria bacterium]|nr:MAG: STAS domain-containing protein [Actinomycetota bacterium]
MPHGLESSPRAHQFGGRMRQERDLAPFSLTIIGGRPAIRGDCDIAAARDIEAWLATFDSQPLEVDVSGVTFFDSSALRAFLNVHRRNRHMRMVEPSEAVLKTLEITGTIGYLVDSRDTVAR